MTTKLNSYREAIDRFPSTAELAAAVGRPPSTVRSWRARDSIPPEYFALIGAAARKRRIAVTARQLIALFSARVANQTKGE